MTGMTPRPCRSCGAPLIWGLTAAGKRMPVDATDPLLAPIARVVDTYVSHFATCPKAAEHRQPRPAQPGPQGKPR